MNDNEYLAGIAGEFLRQGSPLVLASIVKQEGSAPRHIGTKMLIGVDGKGYGTIGGSALEADTIREGGAVLVSGRSKFIDFDLTNQDVNLPGMICGGKATVMLEYIGPTQENLDFFRSLSDMSVNGVAFALFTVFDDDRRGTPEISRCLIINSGEVEGRCPLPEADLKRLLSETRRTDTARVVRLKNWQVIVEPMQKIKTLYCFGAGHVSQPTAHMAALAGFRVAVVDGRAEFANIERFPDAWSILVIDDYNEAFKDLHIDEDSFIVIFTHSHLYDRFVLKQALKTGAGYIGMIASQRKRDSIYQALIAQGIRQEELARVRSPIGLNIGAETPEEIAVSIVAELIQERSRKNT